MFYINTETTLSKAKSTTPTFFIGTDKSRVPTFKIGTPKDKNVTEEVLISTELEDLTVIPIEQYLDNYIQGVVIDGYNYVENINFSGLLPGQFFVNAETRELYIVPVKNISSKVIIKLKLSPVPLLHNQVTNVPEILTRDNVIATLSVRRSLKDHPSASISIMTDYAHVKQILEEFCDRNKQYIFYGMPFRLVEGGITQKVHKLSEFPFGNHHLNISFEGWWKKPLEEDIYYRIDVKALRKKLLDEKGNFTPSPEKLAIIEQLKGLQGFIPGNMSLAGIIKYLQENDMDLEECYPGNEYLAKRMELDPDFATKFPITASMFRPTPKLSDVKEPDEFRPEQSKVDIVNIGLRNNVPIFTPKTLYTYFPKNTNPRTTTTISSELNKVAEHNSLVVMYSRVEGVYLVKWSDGANRQLNQEEIITEMDITKTSCAQDGLKPTKITWNRFNPNNVMFNQKPKFMQRRRPKNVIHEPDDGSYSYPPPHYTNFEDISMVFDNSGERKQYIIKEMQGDILVKETTMEYGVLALGVQAYNPETGKLQGHPGAYWTCIKRLVKNFQYDYATGYYLGYQLSGWHYTRFKQETSALETVWLTEELNNPDLDNIERSAVRAELNQYIFKMTPIKGYERLLLSQYRDYYMSRKVEDRIEELKRHFAIWEECTPGGKVVYKTMLDPTYVEPMFISQTETSYGGISTMPNPYNITKDAEEKPRSPLTTGEDRYERTIVRIFKSRNTRNDSFLAESGKIKRMLGSDDNYGEDKYKTITTSQAAQDYNFANSAQQSGETISQGRPPSGNSVGTPYITYQEYIDNQAIVVQKTTEEWGDYKTYQDKWDTYIYTDPYTEDSVPSTNNWSFDTYEKKRAMEMAQIRYEIERYYLQDRYTFSCLFKPEYIEGDYLTFDYEFEKYKGKILSISHVITIQGKLITHDGKQVYTGSTSLELLKNPPDLLPLKQFRLPIEDNKHFKYLYLFKVFKRGFELGGRSSNYPFRRRGLS